MNAIETAYRPTGALSAAARERLISRFGEPLLLADWRRVLMMHFEVDAAALQREVPFELDLHDRRAFVSLVAFTIHSMRPRALGRLGRWIFRPIATHGFLNVRTYVRHGGESGIYFLAEWLDNPWSVRLGPWPFGLPYRLGDLDYQHEHESGKISGTVRDASGSGQLRYSAMLPTTADFQPCKRGVLDEFLMERYTAFTHRGGVARFFRVWHPPWAQVPAEVVLHDQSLLEAAWPWFREARCVSAHYSPGLRDVWMSRPFAL